MGPAWIADTLSGLLLVIAGYDLARLGTSVTTGRPTERDVDAFHAAMGVSMAGMLLGRLTPFDRQTWAVIFAVATVWFVLRLPWAVAGPVGERSHLAHRLALVVSSGAMVYMLLAMDGTGLMDDMSHASGSVRLPFLAALLAVALFAAAMAHAERSLVRPARRELVAVRPGTGPSEALSMVDAAAMGTDGRVAGGSVWDPRADVGRMLAPRTAAAAEVAMGLVMVYMLVTMV